jgi:hypothetical protein
MGMIDRERQALYRRHRSEEQRRRKRDGLALLFFGLVLYALMATIAIRLYADEAPPLPTMTCAHFGGIKPPRVRCVAAHVGDASLEWRLYGDSDDALTDFNEGNDFRFEAPTVWRLVELRVIATDERRIRIRLWVRWQGREIEFRRIGQEGQ